MIERWTPNAKQKPFRLVPPTPSQRATAERNAKCLCKHASNRASRAVASEIVKRWIGLDCDELERKDSLQTVIF